MGKAIIIRNVDWSLKNLGQVTPARGLIIIGLKTIKTATTYTVLYEGEIVSATWNIAGSGTLNKTTGSEVEVTPTEAGNITLSATYIYNEETYTASLNIVSALPHLEISPISDIITKATTFTAYYDNEIDTNVSWSISDSTLASLTDNHNGTCVITPLISESMDKITLTATSSLHGTETLRFVPTVSTLPEEYTRMLYVQGHTARLDTGLKPTNNTRVILDFQYIHNNSNTSFAYVLDDDGVHNITLNAQNAAIIFNGLTVSATLPRTYKRRTVDLNQQRVIIDGTEYLNTNEDPTTWTSTGNLWLFGGKNTGTNRSSASRIYRCKIYDGDTLLRDYIPCQRISDDVYGLYDLVNELFYVPTTGVLYGQKSDPDYITDGLIAKFDGYDASTTYWGDTYNSLFGISLNSVSKTSDGMGVIFNGGGCSAANPADYSNDAATINSGTIEVVYKVDDMPSAYMVLVKGYTANNGDKGKMAFWIDGNGYVRNDFYTAKEVNNSISNYLGRTITQSVNATLNYVNGISLGKEELATSTASPGATSQPAIGCFRTSAVYAPFTGTIYQVRIYNRELTAAEIQHNQKIDMIRYNINNQ